MPLAAKPATASPNGSTNTLPRSPSMRKADCPNLSTRMLLLRSKCQEALVGMVVLAAAQQRSCRRHETRDDGERERGVQAVAERARYQLREEGMTRDQRAVVAAETGEPVGAHEVLYRVVAEERREQ